MKKTSTRVIAFVMMLVMLVGMIPMNVVAEGGSVSTYEEFLSDFKILETYAEEYAASVFRDPGELVLNFIRTGVERYQDDNWTTLAGVEIVGFTNYVAQKDAETGSSVMDLRDIKIENFYLPNDNQTDFGHMFGCMNISYVAPGSADLSGWAGDICDLLQYSVSQLEDINLNTDGTVEDMAEYIREYCFGVNATGAYGWDDFYGDMDAYYLVSEYKKGTGKFSELMEAYFDGELDDVERSVYFMNNRFAVEDSREAVRKAIYEAYCTDVGLKVLEAKRELTSYSTLRQACCYAFADYIYENAKGQLVPGEGGSSEVDNEYYTVFSSDHSILAPGIEQKINYAKTADGKQIVYYVATVDINRDDVTIMANYKDNDPSKGWGYQRVEDQVTAMVKNYKDKYEYFTPVVATNADGYNMSTGEPGGLLVMDGVEWHAVDRDGFFAILKDGSAMIGTYEDYATYKDQLKEAVGGFGGFLVKDGKIAVTKNANYAASRASRTAIGIKADGSVVMMVLDGRQLPFSAGGAMEEIAQIMYDAGCVTAINLDGGGSTTYLSKPAGQDNITLVNRPSDGYARSVSTSLVAVSFAKSSNEFEHAIISSDYDYITAGTTMQFNVIGVSNTGNTAPIPEGAYWKVSDTSIATIDAETGLFTAIQNGKVTVDFMIGEESTASVEIAVVTPDSLSMESDSINAIYGVPTAIPIVATYKGYPVATKPEDFFVALQYETAGTIDGLTFTANEESGYRNFMAGAYLVANQNLLAYVQINMFREDESMFDFENATYGNRTLAWNREVFNTHTTDNLLYRISNPGEPVNIEYTFALDMTTIEVPVQLEPLQGMLPGADAGNVSAWNFLLQLAERVCELTNVTITATFSENLDVNIDELKVVNEYFVLSSAVLSENNVLTVKCNWIDQTAAIDAATANPICILTGIKATVKEEANYVNNEILISNNGNVSYDVYLAASSLYSFVTDPANDAQNLYGLYPYEHDPACRTDGNDKGAHFSSQYAEFADIYVINSEVRQGWIDNSYYVDNNAVTGVKYIPSKGDPTKYLFYEFDSEGICLGVVSGLIEYEGALYYALAGERQIRWVSLTDENGNEVYYYFDPTTGKAVDGVQQINEGTIFTYTFENHILVKGDLRYHTCRCVGTANEIAEHVGVSGLGYRWAGRWLMGQWIEVDGNKYYLQKYHNIVDTGFIYKSSTNQDVPVNGYYLFDETGVFQENFTGLYGDYYVKNGIANNRTNRIVQIDGYYYCATSELVIMKNNSRYINSVIADEFKDVIPEGTYYFDEQGRMINPLVDVVGEEKIEGCEVLVMGKVVKITPAAGTPACRVGYLKDGKYVAIEAQANGDGSYTYLVPAEVKEITVNVIGDVNSDGKLDEADLKLLAESLMPGAEALGALAEFVGDLNGNGKINSADRVLLARMLLPETHELHLEFEW